MGFNYISILQSSIKTVRYIRSHKRNSRISILQSSIKTSQTQASVLKISISILQSSIKTGQVNADNFKHVSFQFYKVRLKLQALKVGTRN